MGCASVGSPYPRAAVSSPACRRWFRYEPLRKLSNGFHHPPAESVLFVNVWLKQVAARDRGCKSAERARIARARSRRRSRISEDTGARGPEAQQPTEAAARRRSEGRSGSGGSFLRGSRPTVPRIITWDRTCSFSSKTNQLPVTGAGKSGSAER